MQTNKLDELCNVCSCDISVLYLLEHPVCLVHQHAALLLTLTWNMWVNCAHNYKMCVCVKLCTQGHTTQCYATCLVYRFQTIFVFFKHHHKLICHTSTLTAKLSGNVTPFTLAACLIMTSACLLLPFKYSQRGDSGIKL